MEYLKLPRELPKRCAAESPSQCPALTALATQSTPVVEAGASERDRDRETEGDRDREIQRERQRKRERERETESEQKG
eukprot:3366712-Rhodomonas_salina.1